jgi:hypothetical protein
MHRTMTIRFTDAPVAAYVRTQTEWDCYDEPVVRYLRRAQNGKPPSPRLAQEGAEDRLVLKFAGLEVNIQAHEDHIAVILIDVSGTAAKQARAA